MQTRSQIKFKDANCVDIWWSSWISTTTTKKKKMKFMDGMLLMWRETEIVDRSYYELISNTAAFKLYLEWQEIKDRLSLQGMLYGFVCFYYKYLHLDLYLGGLDFTRLLLLLLLFGCHVLKICIYLLGFRFVLNKCDATWRFTIGTVHNWRLLL